MSSSSPIDQQLAEVNKQADTFIDHLGGMVDGIKTASGGVKAIIGVIQSYTVALDDSARLLQRNTNLLGSNIDEFKKFNKDIKEQSMAFSSATGQTIQEAQKSIAAFQSAFKTFDVNTSLSLTSSELIKLRKAADDMARNPYNEEMRQEYEALSDSIPKAQKELIELQNQIGGLAIRSNMTSDDIGNFVNTLKGTLDLDMGHITEASTLIDAARDANVSYAELMNKFKENEEILIGLDEKSKMAQLKQLTQAAADIKKAGYDFTKASAQISGDDGEDRITKAAMLASMSGQSMEAVMDLMDRQSMGGKEGQNAAKELTALQARSQMRLSGMSEADLRLQQDMHLNPNAYTTEQRGNMAMRGNVGAMIGNEVFGGAAFKNNREISAALSRLDIADRRGSAGDIDFATEEERNRRNADTSSQKTLDESIQSGITDVAVEVMDFAGQQLEGFGLNLEEANGHFRELLVSMGVMEEVFRVGSTAAGGLFDIGSGIGGVGSNALGALMDNPLLSLAGGGAIGGLIAASMMGGQGGDADSEIDSLMGTNSDSYLDRFLGTGTAKGELTKTQQGRQAGDMPAGAESLMPPSLTTPFSPSGEEGRVGNDLLKGIMDVLEGIAMKLQSSPITQNRW